MMSVAELRLKSAPIVGLHHPAAATLSKVRIRPADAGQCQKLLNGLVSGEKVLMSQVRKAIGSDHSQDLNDCVNLNRAMREMDLEAAAILRPYTLRLRIADLLSCHSERRNISPRARKSLTVKAEARYEAALEILLELIHCNVQVQVGLDRDGALSSPEKDDVPRRKKLALKTADIKLDALRRCIDAT